MEVSINIAVRSEGDNPPLGYGKNGNRNPIFEVIVCQAGVQWHKRLNYMSSKNTFRLLFFVNKSKTNKDGAPIMLRITINGSQVAMNVRRRIQLMDWDLKTGMPHVHDAFTDDLHMYLETLRNKAFNAFTELSKAYDEVTPQLVRDHLQGVKGGTTRTIRDVWQEHNQELKRVIGKECSYTLWQKHNTALNHFSAFMRSKYRVLDMPVKQVRFNIVLEFQEYLIGEKDLSYNSAIKVLQLMKKITSRSLKSGWLKVDPFLGISLTLKETDRPYLTEDELQAIHQKEFRMKRLELVKDLFLFSCYTGMAYADVKKLCREELEKTPDGLWWIKTRRQKTRQKSQIPLLYYAKEIIDKYINLEDLTADQKVLPVMSNQKLNSYLKEIADLCGIEKQLTYHVMTIILIYTQLF